MENFGGYLRSLREDRKLSLRDVAAQTGVSVSYILQMEQGKRQAPGNKILKKLAQSYSVPVKDLLKSAGYMDDLESVAPVIADDEEVDRAFHYAITDPRFKYGNRLTGPVTTDVKRFVVELYEKATGKKLLSGD